MYRTKPFNLNHIQVTLKECEIFVKKAFYVPSHECMSTLKSDTAKGRLFSLVKKQETCTTILCDHSSPTVESVDTPYCLNNCSSHRSFVTIVTITVTQWRVCNNVTDGKKCRIGRRTTKYEYDGLLTDSNQQYLPITITIQKYLEQEIIVN